MLQVIAVTDISPLLKICYRSSRESKVLLPSEKIKAWGRESDFWGVLQSVRAALRAVWCSDCVAIYHQFARSAGVFLPPADISKTGILAGVAGSKHSQFRGKKKAFCVPVL